MAPTEILAEQHDATVRRCLAPLGFGWPLLTGRHREGAPRRTSYEASPTGEAHLLVGTHASFRAA